MGSFKTTRQVITEGLNLHSLKQYFFDFNSLFLCSFVSLLPDGVQMRNHVPHKGVRIRRFCENTIFFKCCEKPYCVTNNKLLVYMVEQPFWTIS